MSRGFRLAAVERLRARRLEDAGGALAQAQQALVEAVARREALRERLLGAAPPRTAEPIEIRTLGELRAQLRDRITAADTEVADLTAKVGAARDSWLAARGDLRAVEALHERYRQIVRTEHDRREQRLADDQAAARHRPPANRPPAISTPAISTPAISTPAISTARERNDLVDGGGAV